MLVPCMGERDWTFTLQLDFGEGHQAQREVLVAPFISIFGWPHPMGVGESATERFGAPVAGASGESGERPRRLRESKHLRPVRFRYAHVANSKCMDGKRRGMCCSCCRTPRRLLFRGSTTEACATAFSASSRNIDLNGEARTARTKQ